MKISEVKDQFYTFLIVERGDLDSTITTYEDDINQFELFVDNKDISELKRYRRFYALLIGWRDEKCYNN